MERIIAEKEGGQGGQPTKRYDFKTFKHLKMTKKANQNQKVGGRTGHQKVKFELFANYQDF